MCDGCRGGGDGVQSILLNISCQCLPAPSSLIHSHAHPVVNTLKIFFPRTDPGSSSLWPLCPADLMFLECPSFQFIYLFIFLFFAPPPPISCSFLFLPLCSEPSTLGGYIILESKLNAAFHFSRSSVTGLTMIGLVFYQVTFLFFSSTRL